MLIYISCEKSDSMEVLISGYITFLLQIRSLDSRLTISCVYHHYINVVMVHKTPYLLFGHFNVDLLPLQSFSEMYPQNLVLHVFLLTDDATSGWLKAPARWLFAV